MKITYYGTAAAEGIPGLFCKCRVCENARKVKGKEIKTRSQALVDDKILIDFPADTYMHALNYGLPLEDIHTCIVTHSHMDHLYERELWCRCPGIGNEIPEHSASRIPQPLSADDGRRKKHPYRSEPGKPQNRRRRALVSQKPG
jgi:glyoxylase-like metal-dependent hydrolase (beta-lactamase superfamily II)